MIFWSIFACTPEFSDPTIEFFNPNLVVVGSEIPVTVTGTKFYANPHIRNQNEIEKEEEWLIELKHEDGQLFELRNSNWISPEQIRFDSPPDLIPGVYQLSIAATDGRRAVADEPFTVSPTALADVKWISFENQ